MRHKYHTSGTGGDTYTTVCKLYKLAQVESVKCVHTVVLPDHYEPLIRTIFSLLPSVEVEVYHRNRKVGLPVVHSYPSGAIFDTGKPVVDPPEIEMTWFPDFEFADVSRLHLPKSYTVLAPVSGGKKNGGDGWRVMSGRDIDKTMEGQKNVVVLGSKKLLKLDKNFIDLSGQTSVLEAMQIVKGASHFVGMQGLLLFVALSMRVPSIAYVRRSYMAGFKLRRAIGKWLRYCCDIRLRATESGE